MTNILGTVELLTLFKVRQWLTVQYIHYCEIWSAGRLWNRWFWKLSFCKKYSKFETNIKLNNCSPKNKIKYHYPFSWTIHIPTYRQNVWISFFLEWLRYYVYQGYSVKYASHLTELNWKYCTLLLNLTTKNRGICLIVRARGYFELSNNILLNVCLFV